MSRENTGCTMRDSRDGFGKTEAPCFGVYMAGTAFPLPFPLWCIAHPLVLHPDEPELAWDLKSVS